MTCQFVVDNFSQSSNSPSLKFIHLYACMDFEKKNNIDITFSWNYDHWHPIFKEIATGSKKHKGIQ